MEGIERAIRNAFAKGDAANPATRQRIYESAWSAHEHALAANTSLSDAQKAQRRDRLKATISRIESEFRPARPAAPAAASRARVEPALGGVEVQNGAAPAKAASPAEGPALDRDDVRTARKKKHRDADFGFEGGAPRRDVAKKPRSPFMSYVLPGLILLVFALMGWSLYNSFTDVMNPSRSTALLNGAPAREGEDAAGGKWINIFNPSEPTRISVTGSATAQIAGQGSVGFARVKSPGADDEIIFDVGEGILREIAGKKATFDIIAKSDDGQPTQMSVSCDFGAMGDCGRKRYDVTDARSDFLFDVTFPEGQRATGAGTITINSDVSGAGKAIDIYAIRVSVAQ
ncbi:hypothetical protein GCM10011491_02900 [Brucella endophytica]|uniref:Biotin transporter BioY n=1 Tax=Brucella endophytica TaxID=1963359 RepID=A0A916S0D2_9HYPH|nr:hypothetical protein [Brucella endophytica]GGA79077.1 hypothetical protein GCM10011491_02900 [Brucella endophytica]